MHFYQLKKTGLSGSMANFIHKLTEHYKARICMQLINTDIKNILLLYHCCIQYCQCLMSMCAHAQAIMIPPFS